DSALFPPARSRFHGPIILIRTEGVCLPRLPAADREEPPATLSVPMWLPRGATRHRNWTRPVSSVKWNEAPPNVHYSCYDGRVAVQRRNLNRRVVGLVGRLRGPV